VNINCTKEREGRKINNLCMKAFECWGVHEYILNIRMDIKE